MPLRWKDLAVSLLALVLMITTIMGPRSEAAWAASTPLHPIAHIAMSNKADAAAKDLEGRLESAYGDLTGDQGHQLKGKAKQVQASAMNVMENLKEGAGSVAKTVRDAAANVADDLS
ncbi:MAG: CsbD family protein [Cyanobacteriota bacterium]|nr:CsbD family protein [Cyanobacteriota bacterium]